MDQDEALISLPEEYNDLILTKKDIRIVFEMWEHLPKTTAAEVYSSIFSSHEQLRTLFSGDLEKQYQMITNMLDTVVRALYSNEVELKTIIQKLETLGRRHIRYKLTIHYYPVFGEFLVYNFEKTVDGFSASILPSWVRVYTFITEIMMRGSTKPGQKWISEPPPKEEQIEAAISEISHKSRKCIVM